jgi:hypothetical protein
MFKFFLFIFLYSFYLNATPIAFLGCVENSKKIDFQSKKKKSASFSPLGPSLGYGLLCQNHCNCIDSINSWCNDGPIGDGRCISNHRQLQRFLLPPLSFDNRFHRQMDGEQHHFAADLRSRSVFEAHYVDVVPLPAVDLSTAVLAFVNHDVAADLSLSSTLVDTLPLCFFAGQCLASGAVAYAHVYAGHQFGGFSRQLGDGRALSLGQLHGYELNVKGGGRTPLSRRGDGVAVLRSSVREVCGSAAMRALGAPTSGVLALLIDEAAVSVPRDPAESGVVVLERPAVVLRVADRSGFVRWGSFELFAARGDDVRLSKLIEYGCASLNVKG